MVFMNELHVHPLVKQIKVYIVLKYLLHIDGRQIYSKLFEFLIPLTFAIGFDKASLYIR